MTSTRCQKCEARFFPRGGLPPRYCPVCGHRLSTAPAAGRGPAQRTALRAQPPGSLDGRAIVALVLGFFSFAMPGLGLAAVVIGALAHRGINRSPTPRRGSGAASAGIILGMMSLMTHLGCLMVS